MQSTFTCIALANLFAFKTKTSHASYMCNLNFVLVSYLKTSNQGSHDHASYLFLFTPIPSPSNCWTC